MYLASYNFKNFHVKNIPLVINLSKGLLQNVSSSSNFIIIIIIIIIIFDAKMK